MVSPFNLSIRFSTNSNSNSNSSEIRKFVRSPNKLSDFDDDFQPLRLDLPWGNK